MILEFILNIFFFLIEFLIWLLPDLSFIDPFSDIDISGFLYWLSYAFVFFPYSLFVLIIGNITFWLSIQMVWAFIEWIYKKIPGIN